jgi:hypothetical protein
MTLTDAVMRVGILCVVLADADHEGRDRKGCDNDQGFGGFHSRLLWQKLYDDEAAFRVTEVTEPVARRELLTASAPLGDAFVLRLAVPGSMAGGF